MTPPGAPAAAVLDRHPRLAILLLILLPFVVHLPQWLLPTHSDPMWLFGSLATHLERAWLPGHNFLDPNIGFVSEALGRVAARDWLHGVVPWWTSLVGIGTPLAGQMQPSAFLLPFVLLLALPGGIVWLTIAMQMLAGLATHALLRELRLGRAASLVGAALFALNGTIAWVPGPEAIVCALAFLPLLLFGIERCRRPDQGPASMLAIAGGIAGSLLAGFPETAYLDGLLGLAWAGLRIAGGPFGAIVARRVIGGGLLGLLLATPLLIAFADELAGSNLAGAHSMGLAALGPPVIPLLLMPAVYGPINAGAGAVGIIAGWGNVGGYSSVLIVTLALLSLLARGPDRGLRLLLAAWVVLALAKTFGLPPVMALVNLLPAMRSVAFYRYCDPQWELALIVLAADGLDALRPTAAGRLRPGVAPRLACAIAVTLVLAGICAWLAWRAGAAHWSILPHATLAALLAFSAAGTVALLGAGGLVAMLRPRQARPVVGGLALLEAVAMFCLPQLAGGRGGDLDLGAIRFLQAHAGLAPVVTLGPVAPNYGSYFGFGMLNHNMLPVPQLWLDYIDAQLLPGVAAPGTEGATFWPVRPPPLDIAGAVAAMARHRANYQAMGIRYVIAPKQAGPLPQFASAPLAGPNAPIPIHAGETATMDVAVLTDGAALGQVGVLLGTYQGAADGDLLVRACVAGTCGTGRRAAGSLADNSLAWVLLDKPLPMIAGTNLHLTLGHRGGTRPLAVWTWSLPAATAAAPPAGLGVARLLSAPGLTAPVGVQLSLRAAGDGTWRQVFSGDAMDVWQTDNPLHYFDAAGCTLRFASRLSVAASCSRPATLIRRELAMPGWRARVNGTDTTVTPIDGVLQQVALPAGPSEVRFSFIPPHMEFGLAALLAALSGIGWQILRLLRPPRRLA